MTEIYKQNGLSIQVFDAQIVTPAAIGNTISTITLNRAGNFMGGDVCFVGEGADMDNVRLSLANSVSGRIVYGDATGATMQWILRQTDAVARTLNVHAVIFLGVSV